MCELSCFDHDPLEQLPVERVQLQPEHIDERRHRDAMLTGEGVPFELRLVAHSDADRLHHRGGR